MPADTRRAVATDLGRPLSSDARLHGRRAGWRLDKGNGWWDGDYRSTLYNHYLTPNSKQYDCWQPSPPHNPASRPPGAMHPGGVNVLFCDGHVAFVKDSVSLATWRALATRGGGEVISAPTAI